MSKEETMKKVFIFIILIGVLNQSKAQVIEPMLKSSWHQTAPFNNHIPNHINAGCGPIAVAQIVNFYKTPMHGYGHVTLYNDFDYSESSINYNSILDEYIPNKYTNPQADAVANLVYHVGAAMTIKYHQNKSAADNNRMIWGLQKYLHFSPKSRFRLRKFYSTKQWMKMLNEQLDAGRPVYYRGRAFKTGESGDGAGHIFVIDGRDAQNRYHANFGHARKSEDKYINLDVINQTSGNYPGDYGVYYNWEQGMATDFYPDTSFDESEFNDYPLYLDEPLVLNNQKTLNELALQHEEEFDLSTVLRVYNSDYIKNLGIKWKSALGIYKDGRLIEIIEPKQTSFFAISSKKTLKSCYKIPSRITDGEYEIIVMIQNSIKEKWYPVWDIAPNFITAVVEKDKVTLKTMGNHTLHTHLYLKSPINDIGEDENNLGRLFALDIKNPTDNNFENKVRLDIKIDGNTQTSLEHMTSVYSDCQVEYRILIPTQIFDFSNVKNYTIEAYYYEHNDNKYIPLNTEIPEIVTIKSLNENSQEITTIIYNTNGVLIKKNPYENSQIFNTFSKGCYIIQKGNYRKKIMR